MSNQIPQNHKQPIHACSIRFGGCGYFDYACNIPETKGPQFLNNRLERLCPNCLNANNPNDMLRLSKVNFKYHVKPEHHELVKDILKASGITSEWMVLP